MDNNIRQLLAASRKQSDEGDGSFLHQAHSQLGTAAQSKATIDGNLPFGQDLFVICAEVALERGESAIATDSLRMFFMKSPPPNQFLCRAYLCHAHLLAPTSAEDKDQLDKAVVFILKAMGFAKRNPRYHFMVYNASVLYWQFCRPFLKPTYRRCLSASLHSVVRALEEVKDHDHEWRAQLMIALVECLVDAGQLKEAGEISRLASELTKANIPEMHREVLALQIRFNLIDGAKLAKELRNSSDLTAFQRIVKLRVGLEQQEVTDVEGTMARLISQLLKEEELSRPSSVLGATGRKTPVEERTRATPSLPAAPDGLSRMSTVTSIAQVATAASDVGPHNKQSGGTCDPDALSINEQPRLLLEMAYLCSEYDQPELLKRCLNGLKTLNIRDNTVYLSMEFLDCELMVRGLGFAQEMYTKNAVEVRLQAIERLSEAVTNAVRAADPNVIQVGSVTMWNICLPLLQPNMRRKLRRPLTLIAEALQDIDSLLILLRCQLHTELAKIEEEEEQIQLAMEHLKKAIIFDDGGQYSDRLQTLFHRLKLRTELYKSPERSEDKAAMIIEQARKSSDSGTVRKKRSLLVQAGQALSPDAFLLVLESESETGGGGGNQTLYAPLGSKAEHFKKCVKKAAGHTKRLGTENDKERARLWADLAKTARKQEVWDICRVAARFCLLYDNDRWKVPPLARPDTRPDSDQQQPPSSEAGGGSIKRAKTPSQQSVTVNVAHTDRDLIRMLVEVNFLNSEALVHLLRSHGVDLNNDPIPPVDSSKKPKGHVATKPEDSPEWLTYRDWIHELSKSSLDGFLRAAELGVQLNEPWIVCSAAVYVWNYCSHVLQANRHQEMVSYFQTLLGYLKQVGHSGETGLIVNLCDALATGLLTPWVLTPQVEASSPTPKGKGTKDDVRKAKSVTSHTSTKSKTVLSDPEAIGQLKKALEVCEYALSVSSGTRNVIVPIAVKHALLKTWVRVKQLLSQQITKTFGSDDEENTDGQTFVTRCLVALEMLTLNGNGLTSFKEAPVLEELCNMADSCKWPDSLVELQVWTRISQLALKSRNHPSVLRCSRKALTFDLSDRIRRLDRHRQTVWYELLSHAACIQGQSYILGMTAGDNVFRRQATEAFVKAAKYAKKANNAALVVTAARRYWNACLPFITEPMERQLLKHPLAVVLECIHTTCQDIKMQIGAADQVRDSSSAVMASDSVHDVGAMTGDVLSDPEDDLTLRAAMYGVLFQAYTDQGEYEEALAAMDKAISNMPRTRHRLLIFKHRLMVKAKLGQDIHVDIAKFKDESEDYVAMMWHKVAVSSQDKGEQLTAYQNAINTLKLSSSDWQKVDYILEFAEWQFINQLSMGNCVDQMDWAVDILLTMRVETKQRSNDSAKNHRGRKGGRKSASQKSQTSEEPAYDTSSLTSDPLMSQLRSIKLLDHLTRAHVMIALAAGRGSPRHKQACLMAWGLLNRMWQVSLPSAAIVAKQQAKATASQEQANTKTPAAKGKPAATKDAKQAKVPEPVKPKHNGPLDALPVDCREWASYELPEEIRQAFTEDDSGEGINSGSIIKPMLSVYYLLKLVTEMRAVGYNHLVFPALTLAEVIARDICSSDTTGNTCRLIAMEVCTELNLLEAAKVHESVTVSPGLSDAEQASSREEICLLQEKQAQIELESKRTQDCQRQMLLSSQGGGELDQNSKSRKKIPATQKPIIEESIEGLGDHLSSVIYRQAWTQQAEVLIRLGFYQAAREFLNEALISAKAFNDDYTLVQILTNLADLAFREGEYSQCINVLGQAQRLKAHEDLWLKNVLLLADVTLVDVDDAGRYVKAEAILTKALHSFQELKSSRPNKDAKIGFITAEINARLISVRLNKILIKRTNPLHPSSHHNLLEINEMLQGCSTEFVACGHKRRAVEIMEKQGTLLRALAQDCLDRETRHSFLLQAYSTLEQAVVIMDLELTEILTFTTQSEANTLSLPLARETSRVKNSFADLLLDMFAVYATEQRQLRLQETRKTSIEKMVAEYTAVTPDLTDTEKQWQQIAGLTGQMAVVQLTAALKLANQYVPLETKSLLNLGRCFNALGNFYSPSPSRQWDVHYMNLTERVAEPDISQEEEEGMTGENREDGHKVERLTTKLKFGQEVSERYISQAMEVLSQCIQISLQENLKDIISEASLLLVECCGQFDQSLATQYLALYQSCKAAQSMSEMLARTQSDPRTSQQAALLHQQRIMGKHNVTTNWTNSAIAAAVRQNLSDSSEAWRKLSVSPQDLDSMKDFPANIVILQHNEDRSAIYGALIERPKSPATKETGKGKPITNGPPRSRIIKVNVDPMAIANLTQSMTQHKADVMQALLKLQFNQSQHAQQQHMLENLTDDMKESLKDSAKDCSDTGEQLQESFTAILKELEDHLQPITTYLEPLLKDIDCGSLAVGKDSSSVPSEVSVVILADQQLLQLPLEALSLFSSPAITSLSRDFSLQMLYHRAHKEPEANAGDEADDKKKKAAAAAAAKEKAAKEKDKNKAVKMVPIDRTPPSHCIPLDTNSFKYIIDPFCDIDKSEDTSPIRVCQDALELYQNQFTARWEGMMGDDHVPSLGEWEETITDCGSFIFYGMERFLSNLPPFKLAPMDLSECNLALVLDVAQTSHSFMRQSKIDVEKRITDLSLEEPVNTAALLSLVGVSCIMANQWHCSLTDNANSLQSILKALLESGRTPGQTVREMSRPSPEPEETQKRAISASDQQSQGKDGGSRQGRKSAAVKSGKAPMKGPAGPPERSSSEAEEDMVEVVDNTTTVQDEAMRRNCYNIVCYGLPNFMVANV